MVLWQDEVGCIRGFEISGHAGFGEYGHDIVCAGISVLSIAAANGLEHFLSARPEVKQANGFLSCQLVNVSEAELDQAQWILKTMVLGIEDIQRSYGQEYIMIDWRRWTPC